MNLVFKCVYMTNLFTNVSKDEYIFEIPLVNSLKVKIHIDPYNLKEVTCYYECPVSDKLYSSLQQGYDNDSLRHSEKKELVEVRTTIREAYNRFMSTVIYLLDWHRTEENNTGGQKEFVFSFDGENWNLIPYIIFGNLTIGEMSIYPNHTINPHTEQYIQKSLSGGYWSPYIALNYLHKAKRDRDNRHKWINATIAAELAIKEFLITSKPELKTFILEVPSPPLHKLYGSILESFFGQRSPKVAELNKGAQKRNTLIHRPSEIEITDEEVKKYIKDVEQAIFHLYSLTYGDDYLISSYLSN